MTEGTSADEFYGQPTQYNSARTNLRRARIQSALNMGRQGVIPRTHRDRLLEPLAFRILEDDISFGDLSENTVENVVAIALADIQDSVDDRIFILLECLTLLIRDGEFARVALLARRLETALKTADPGRPFLNLALYALASSLQGHHGKAVSDLVRNLRPDVDAPTYGEIDPRPDLLLAAALRNLLSSDGSSRASEARDLFMRRGDGLAVAVIECALAWHGARSNASPHAVLAAADDTYQIGNLERYVRHRGIDVLFPAQIAAIREGLTTDRQMTVSLPTSSGKTLLAEFKIVATLARYPESTAIYVAPYRLLARQVARSFESNLAKLGHVVQDLGSGFETDAPGRFGNILIATPERLDALFRAAADDPECADVFNRCRLLVFDEMHLIGREGRGPRFELLLTRLRSRLPDINFLALSAASQGVDEVAEWLTDGNLVRGGRRPTGTIEVVWRTSGQISQRSDRTRPIKVAELPRKTKKPMEDAAFLVSRLTTEYHPVLIICTKRSSAESIAEKIADDDPVGCRIWIEQLTASKLESLTSVIAVVSEMMGPAHPLTRCLQNGVGFHHAGVPTVILGLIEELAADRTLKVLCATTTVAEGADLPFRTVIIPHLNFPGASGKLERDLYLNIIGRAGRVGVAMEGIVFILDSDARTLTNHVATSLWTTAEVGRVRGQLPGITPHPADPDEFNWYGEFESQVMAWLGDGDSYHANQAERLASRTFSFVSGNSLERRSLVDLTRSVLVSLEERGLAVAGSPLRLTDRGARARLTGLSADSARKLETAVADGVLGWLPELQGAVEVTQSQADQIARMIFESPEALTNSLWLKREFKHDRDKARYLVDFARTDVERHLDSEIFWHEVHALSLWIRGESLDAIAESMPTFGRTGLFGSSDPSRRVSDVAEYVSRIGYPGSWTWSAAQSLAAGAHDLELPTWISGAVEHGAYTETAVYLMRAARVSRPGALRLAKLLGPSWQEATEILREDDPELTSDLTDRDQDRVYELQVLLEGSSAFDLM